MCDDSAKTARKPGYAQVTGCSLGLCASMVPVARTATGAWCTLGVGWSAR